MIQEKYVSPITMALPKTKPVLRDPGSMSQKKLNMRAVQIPARAAADFGAQPSWILMGGGSRARTLRIGDTAT